MGSQILGQAGHKVFTLSNGDQVHSFVVEHHPDVAILDLRMPGISGVDLCVKIKSDKRLESTKVLLLAGPLDHIDSKEVESAGSDGVIQKPLDAHTLTSMIDRLFEGAADAAEESVNEPPGRPISLVDPPPPPSRAFTGNGEPGLRASPSGAGSKVNGSPPPPAPPATGSEPLRQAAPEVAGAGGTTVVEPPPRREPAPSRPLEVASKEIMEEISDVVLGAMAPAAPKPRPRENGYAAAPLRANGTNGHAGKSLDPFAALVENALGTADHDAEFEARVTQIVDDAVQGAMHTIRERITHEVIASYRRISV
jgi:CheY-like chemotaxis protein